MSKLAVLRVCASCEWIFRNHDSCPKCGFVHYGARYVYGDKAYKYERTQEPWKKKKLLRYEDQLDNEIARKALEGEKYDLAGNNIFLCNGNSIRVCSCKAI